jgi:hypothetical protein
VNREVAARPVGGVSAGPRHRRRNDRSAAHDIGVGGKCNRAGLRLGCARSVGLCQRGNATADQQQDCKLGKVRFHRQPRYSPPYQATRKGLR